ncbi:hypothetical protein WJX74_003391 [Apatococcus lobatus]|uniref:Uncharacterized protein n=1 Tax=Apatococcus lobatus TaxID=904363 RepID=A0AAW1QK42_9CHLO
MRMTSPMLWTEAPGLSTCLARAAYGLTEADRLGATPPVSQAAGQLLVPVRWHIWGKLRLLLTRGKVPQARFFMGRFEGQSM